MIRITKFTLALITVASILAGCATIMSGTDQSVMVRTEKSVYGASCELTDSKGRKWYVPETPGTVTILKGDAPLSVVCRKEGYRAATLQIDETVAGATFGNILLGGLIGVAVDAASGAAQKYPGEIVVWMQPEKWDSEDDRERWLREKAAFDEALKEKIAEQRDAAER